MAPIPLVAYDLADYPGDQPRHMMMLPGNVAVALTLSDGWLAASGEGAGIDWGRAMAIWLERREDPAPPPPGPVEQPKPGTMAVVPVAGLAMAATGGILGHGLPARHAACLLQSRAEHFGAPTKNHRSPDTTTVLRCHGWRRWVNPAVQLPRTRLLGLLVA